MTREWFEHMFLGAENQAGDRWGHRWKGSQKYRHSLCLRMIGEYLKSRDGLTVLDIGCALAEFTYEMLRLNPRNKIRGVDISENALRIIMHTYCGLEFEIGQLPHLGFPDHSFDLITALEIVGYLDEDERTLAFQNIDRMLKPGGLFLFSGGVNRGPDYFEPNEILHKISESFEVKNVEYNYARLCKKLGSVYNIRTKWMAAILAKTTKWILGQKGATHIFILARKT